MKPSTSIKIKNRLLWFLALVNVVVIVVMQSYADSLKPYSIIGFEFAGSVEQAQLMISTWDKNNVLADVFFVTGFDYLFMATYSSFLVLACLRLAQELPEKLSKLMVLLAWLQPVAAVLDAVENFALYKLLSGSFDSWLPTLAGVCAAPKFAIALTAVLVCSAAAIYVMVKNKRAVR